MYNENTNHIETRKLIEQEITDLTIKLNLALKELDEEGNGFIDQEYFRKPFEINRELGQKIKLKNSLL